MLRDIMYFLWIKIVFIIKKIEFFVDCRKVGLFKKRKFFLNIIGYC